MPVGVGHVLFRQTSCLNTLANMDSEERLSCALPDAAKRVAIHLQRPKAQK